ncbi:probable methyltransferase-like protein 15 homolog [Drosophila innubila]|uniref:probable methyltransferase-like protein 15 homolog n=1 Tax=Drosophila innubila TaxID=198719 RepID=UPI00148BD23C|nr:probable methyltransferase-like protein 15 homolog [Drosophila innubila]
MKMKMMSKFLTRLRSIPTQQVRHYTAAVTPSASSPAPGHVPVLCQTAIDYLQPLAGGKYIDMTFGAGGHTRRLLDSCPEATVYALDRDPLAHELAQRLSQEPQYEGRLVALLGKFSELPQLLQDLDVPRHSIDGMLFDFGCSSMQFDEAARGFSISHNGPLDMRMDCGRTGGVSAADVLARAEEADLARILRVYGEEKAAKKIARAIVEARGALQRIETTRQLADLVSAVLGEGQRLDRLQRPAHAATKTFQALRIFVNNELNEINYGMLLAQEYLRAEGRLVAITFHSLEDTIVKRHINGNVIEGVANPVPLKYCGYDLTHDPDLLESFVQSNWRQLHRHVILPDASEIARNSRSRSAKLRAAIKIK